MEGPCFLLDSSRTSSHTKLPTLPLLAELSNALWKYVNRNLPARDLQAPLPPLQIGDIVYLSDNPRGDLAPKWQGPFKSNSHAVAKN